MPDKTHTGAQFALFRVVFGLYLLLHFAQLLPWGAELFSCAGVFPDAAANPTHGYFPNLLNWFDAPDVVVAFIVSLMGASVMFAAGLYRKPAALWLWYGLACLLDRNNLILNPSIPFVGLLLLTTLFVPAGEPFSFARRNERWFMPRALIVMFWVALGAGYSFSGLTKLLSPSWQCGEALWLMLDNPLARDNAVHQLVSATPLWVFKLIAWGTVGAELLFLPMCAHPRTRKLAWCGMTVMHLGVLATVGFADLTYGMLMAHLFTLDSAWFNKARARMAKPWRTGMGSDMGPVASAA